MNNAIHKLEFNTKRSDRSTYKLREWKIQSWMISWSKYGENLKHSKLKSQGKQFAKICTCLIKNHNSLL